MHGKQQRKKIKTIKTIKTMKAFNTYIVELEGGEKVRVTAKDSSSASIQASLEYNRRVVRVS